MTTTTWIIIAVGAVLLLAIIALVVGLQLRKKRQITLSKPEERAELTREERSGNYQAGTGFSFTEAGGAGTAVPVREPLPRDAPRTESTSTPSAPSAPPAPSAPADAPETSIVTPEPDIEPGPSAETVVVEPVPVETVVVPPEVPTDQVPTPTDEPITGTPAPVAPAKNRPAGAEVSDAPAIRTSRTPSSLQESNPCPS